MRFSEQDCWSVYTYVSDVITAHEEQFSISSVNSTPDLFIGIHTFVKLNTSHIGIVIYFMKINSLAAIKFQNMLILLPRDTF